MKRYEPCIERQYGQTWASMSESDDGLYVLTSEAQAEIDRLQGLLRRVFDEGFFEGYQAGLRAHETKGKSISVFTGGTTRTITLPSSSSFTNFTNVTNQPNHGDRQP